MPTVATSLTTAALAGALAVASAADRALFAAGLGAVIVVFALGAVRPSAMVAGHPAAWLALIAGGAGLAWTYADDTQELLPLAVVLGPTLVVAIVIQLGRRGSRPELTTSLAMSVAAVVLAVLPGLWLAMRAVSDVGGYSVGLGLLGVGATAAAEAVPVSWATRRVLGVLLSAAAASALGFLVTDLGETVPPVGGVGVAAFTALTTAVAFAVVDRLKDEVPSPPEQVQVTVPADESYPGEVPVPSQAADGASTPPQVVFTSLRISLPFIAAAPMVYVLGRLLIELPS